MRIAQTVTELVGQTPMVRLRALEPEDGAEIWAKLEYLNPGGSVKDRAALGIVLDAERRGVLTPGSTIVEATAGNTGVGLALIGVNRGYRVVLYVPEQFAEEKCILMRALGATVVRTPAEEGMAGAIRRALEYEWQTPGAFAALQFENPANPDFHEQTTAVEIWEQMEGHVDAWISGVGSAGTFTGVARFLKKKRSHIQCIAVEPQGSILQGGEPGPHKVEGIGVSFIPATFDAGVCDRVMRVMDPPAFEMVKRLAAEAGVFAGSSAGAMVSAAVDVARELGPEQRVVTIIPDSAERYLSKGIF
ncbi:cysteine synthase A [Edaphobacter sp. 12200R-103]|jgi:cysteine synthase A|uniref:cysteine synthase A n=1 Tax=Edaphobacter sp. 12200R-103 TaxID=2703788 RepID=UPI00138BF563|nr:cysteine synthase A [Edaphobacter sp. 12200R-103]QHS50500.1 cysteine synthase A [Edaphobacter sp. 12200R-103]